MSATAKSTACFWCLCEQEAAGESIHGRYLKDCDRHATPQAVAKEVFGLGLASVPPSEVRGEAGSRILPASPFVKLSSAEASYLMEYLIGEEKYLDINASNCPEPETLAMVRGLIAKIAPLVKEQKA